MQEPHIPQPTPRGRKSAVRRPPQRRRQAAAKPGTKKRIVILVHENSKPQHRGLYFIAQLAMLWARRSLEIRVMRGPVRRVPGDVLFVHVDLSRVPEPYLAVAAHYPASVNGRVRDIRKSVISRHLVGRDSDWDGPVIVKTDLNCAGLPENRYTGTRGPGLPWKLRTSNDYPIFAHRSEVPLKLLRNPGLVVEKFLPERAGESYCLRSYNFLGDVEDCFLVYSEKPVVNMASITRMEKTDVHPEIRRLREELGFDYGKFDYVVHDGKAILLDANKTPGPLPISDRSQMEMLRRRADGIRSFLR
ncbi:MAG: hypothetical protein HYY48_06275 [Gammaproteobacteria bacterium]|nr:hypothetical protein [Gammaproteobacteria bacterium]